MVNYSKPHSPPNSEDDAGINIIYQLPRIFPAQREQFYKDGMFAKVGRKHMEVKSAPFNETRSNGTQNNS